MAGKRRGDIGIRDPEELRKMTLNPRSAYVGGRGMIFIHNVGCVDPTLF
jgi:hypothetical protein